MNPRKQKVLWQFFIKILGISLFCLSLLTVFLLKNYWIALLLIALANYYLLYPKYEPYIHTLLVFALAGTLAITSFLAPILLTSAIIVILIFCSSISA